MGKKCFLKSDSPPALRQEPESVNEETLEIKEDAVYCLAVQRIVKGFWMWIGY